MLDRSLVIHFSLILLKLRLEFLLHSLKVSLVLLANRFNFSLYLLKFRVVGHDFLRVVVCHFLGKEAQRSHHEEHEEDFLEHIAIFLMFLIRVWRASPFLFTDLSVLSQTIKQLLYQGYKEAISRYLGKITTFSWNSLI